MSDDLQRRIQQWDDDLRDARRQDKEAEAASQAQTFGTDDLRKRGGFDYVEDEYQRRRSMLTPYKTIEDPVARRAYDTALNSRILSNRGVQVVGQLGQMLDELTRMGNRLREIDARANPAREQAHREYFPEFYEEEEADPLAETRAAMARDRQPRLFPIGPYTSRRKTKRYVGDDV